MPACFCELFLIEMYMLAYYNTCRHAFRLAYHFFDFFPPEGLKLKFFFDWDMREDAKGQRNTLFMTVYLMLRHIQKNGNPNDG